MSIFKPKGSKHYWYEFVYNGKRYRKSTKQGNARAAQDIENALKTALAKKDVGIIERPPAPTLKEYAKTFERDIETLKSDRPATIRGRLMTMKIEVSETASRDRARSHS
jgi:hypothetical protein